MGVELLREMTGREGSQDIDTNKRYRRTWIARTSDPRDGASVVLAAGGMPTFNDPYEYVDDSVPGSPVVVTDATVVAVDVRASQDNPTDPQDWRVVWEYAGVADPTAQPAEVEYSPTRYQKALVKDLDNKHVMNSAHVPFEGGITVDRTRFTLVLTRAVLNWDPVAALEYQESVNMFPFLQTVHPPGFAAGTCKLTWGAKRVRRKGTTSFYWLRTAVIEIDKEGWTIKVRDAGLEEAIRDTLDPSVIINHRPMIGPGGSQIASPQLLKDGRKLQAGEAVPEPIQFKGYEVKDWSALGLGY